MISRLSPIREIIKGNIHSVVRQLKELMMEYAGRMEFEKAHIIKEKLELLEKYQSKSTVVNPAINNVDVFAILPDADHAYVNFMKVMNGAIIQVHTVELVKKLDEAPEELLEIAILDIRRRFESQAPEILVPFETGMILPGVTLTVPKIGDKKEAA